MIQKLYLFWFYQMPHSDHNCGSANVQAKATCPFFISCGPHFEVNSKHRRHETKISVNCKVEKWKNVINCQVFYPLSD